MIKYLLFVMLLVTHAQAHGALSGGRPNAISGGQNAFAGVVNPANAVWIKDRFDINVFWIYQKSSLNNVDNNPLFPPGKTDLTYRTKNLVTGDAAIHKQFKWSICSNPFESSFSLASYSVPTQIKLRTKKPIPLAGTTPILIHNKTDVISAIFSLKLCSCHSIGFSIDYLYLSYRRDGFQNSDNPLRSISPGHVTNNGNDHSNGFGVGIGWRWVITKKLDFGAAWARKSYCGQFRKYRGFEPFHAKNYTPQLFGAGLSYKFTPKFAGRFEMVWANLGNLPNANNGVLSDGSLNTHKRGSSKSPGPGLQDATSIILGMGYKVNEVLSVGTGYSHRIKLPRKSSNLLSHSYTLQAIYDTLSFGAHIKYKKHEWFLVLSHNFKNRTSGLMPIEVGGGRFVGEKQNNSFSMTWGYLYY